MKYGTAYKNLTDAVLVIGVAISIICILLAVLAFEGPGMTVENEATGEKITINSAFEDPAVKVYAMLGTVFAVTAVFGFVFRRWFWIPLAASAVAIVVSMDVFIDGTIGEVAYAFVLFGLIGLVGNILCGVITVRERKELAKENEKAK